MLSGVPALPVYHRSGRKNNPCIDTTKQEERSLPERKKKNKMIIANEKLQI